MLLQSVSVQCVISGVAGCGDHIQVVQGKLPGLVPSVDGIDRLLQVPVALEALIAEQQGQFVHGIHILFLRMDVSSSCSGVLHRFIRTGGGRWQRKEKKKRRGDAARENGDYAG